MAIFGGLRDIDTFKIMSKELINDIITQQIGYYKIVLNDTPANIYGESLSKNYIGPVLINCLIERGDFDTNTQDQGPDRDRVATFRFLKDMMVDANVVPEAGDVIMYNELYYQVDNVNSNQLFLGKNDAFAYEDGLENFGGSTSYILTCHYTSGDKLGINQTVPY
jgi:hypothetical protein